MEPIPGTEIRFSKFPEKPHKTGATPKEITKGNLDSSFTLQSIVNNFEKYVLHFYFFLLFDFPLKNDYYFFLRFKYNFVLGILPDL